ncbi:MAG: HD domain-containing protein [Rhizobacter sp.]|nr:HD domain-containing protein [Chlorobiales bacterium]
MNTSGLKHIPLRELLFANLGKVAGELGLACYAVGGHVRDRLLLRASKDIDVMVVGDPIVFAKAVKEKLGGYGFAVFERFRTAQLTVQDVDFGELKLEFVGARKESYDHDSRKPIVEIGSLQDDLSRRDFTINAMAVSLNEKTFGELTDLFGGQSDLAKKILRTPLEPKQTFSDDPLRMMRAARFASKLGFTIEPDVLAAMFEMKDRIKIVSQERITDELLKILMSPVPSVGFEILYRAEILDEVFPELPVMAGVEQIDGLGHKDTFFHTLKVVDNLAAMPDKTRADKLWLRMSALLHDVAKPRTKRFTEGHGWSFHGHDALGANMLPKIFRRMKFPLSELGYVQKMVRLHLRPIPLSREEISDAAIRRLMFDAGEDLEDLLTLCRADVTSKNPKRVQRILQNFAKVEEKISEVTEKDELAKWRPPVSGTEIMELFNLPEGREVGLLKKAMENAVIDGLIAHDKDAAIEFLKRKFEEIKQMPLPPHQKKSREAKEV